MIEEGLHGGAVGEAQETFEAVGKKAGLGGPQDQRFESGGERQGVIFGVTGDFGIDKKETAARAVSDAGGEGDRTDPPEACADLQVFDDLDAFGPQKGGFFSHAPC